MVTSEKVNKDLDHSQKTLTGMKSRWRSFVNVFKGDKKYKEELKEEKDKTDREALKIAQKKIDETTIKSVPAKPATVSNVAAKSRPNGPSMGNTQFDNELNDGLDQIEAMLGNLHTQSLNMNTQIKQQTLKLNNIQDNTESANDKINDQRRQMKTIMGK